MPGPPLLEEDEPAYYKQTASFSKRSEKLLPISHGPNGGKADPAFVKNILERRRPKNRLYKRKCVKLGRSASTR